MIRVKMEDMEIKASGFKFFRLKTKKEGTNSLSLLSFARSQSSLQ